MKNTSYLNINEDIKTLDIKHIKSLIKAQGSVYLILFIFTAP